LGKSSEEPLQSHDEFLLDNCLISHQLLCIHLSITKALEENNIHDPASTSGETAGGLMENGIQQNLRKREVFLDDGRYYEG
jgi:hypothetical protein